MNYKLLARAIQQRYMHRAAALLGPYNSTNEVWPASAHLFHAIIQADGGFVEGQLAKVDAPEFYDCFPIGTCPQELFGAHVILFTKSCRCEDIETCLGGMQTLYPTRSMLDSQKIYPSQLLEYRSVLVLSQKWGQHYYHFISENLIRITPYLPELRQNTGKLKVHVVPDALTDGIFHVVSEFFKILGVPAHKLVSGTIWAETALVPEPVNCGNPSAVMLRMLQV
jgi:hypothetical protein